MGGVRELIHRLDRLDVVSRVAEPTQVARSRCRFATEEHDRVGICRHDRLDATLAKTVAGRVGDDCVTIAEICRLDIRAHDNCTATCEIPFRIACGSTARLDCDDRISFDKCAKQSNAAIQIGNAMEPTVDMQRLGHEIHQHARRVCMALKE